MFGNKMGNVEKAIKKNNESALINLSNNKDTEVALAAIDGLAKVAGEDGAHYLVTRLQSEDTKIRLAVVEALGTIANKHTKAFLSAQLQKEKDPGVLKALREAMAKIKEY